MKKVCIIFFILTATFNCLYSDEGSYNVLKACDYDKWFGKKERIFFLLASAWSNGKNLGEFIINQSRGSNAFVVQPLTNNLNIRDWCSPKTDKQPEGYIAWRSKFSPKTLYLLEWTNPEPYTIINSIELNSNQMVKTPPRAFCDNA